MWINLTFAAVLLCVSACMLIRHRLVWRKASEALVEPRERDYLRRQYRRRLQASSMIGLLGLMVLGGIFVRGVMASAIYWGVALVIVSWMTLLAVADLINTRYFYHQVRQDQLAEQAKLYAELERYHRRDGNGRPEEQGSP